MSYISTHSYSSLSRALSCLLSRASIKTWIDENRIPVVFRNGDRFIITEKAVEALKEELCAMHERRCAKLAKSNPDALRYRLASMQRAIASHDRETEKTGAREPSPALFDEDILPETPLRKTSSKPSA